MFSSIGIKLAIAFGLSALLFGAGAIAMHKVDAGRYNALVASVQQAHAQALQEALDRQRMLDAKATEAAQQEAQAQADAAEQVRQQLSEVRHHVQVKYVASRCVPYGFVRVLDAAALGVSAERLPLPKGKTDSSCAPVGWDNLAQAVIANFGVSHANSEQLDALSHFLRTVK